MRRRILATAITTGLAAASVILTAPAADAATIHKHGYVRDSGCAGHILESKKLIGDSTRILGRVELWYSSRNGGENCVITRSYVGRAHMVAELDVDKDGNKRWSSGDVYSSDDGVYNSYAGGAYRTGTNGHCVRYQGLIWISGDSSSIPIKFAHCGG